MTSDKSLLIMMMVIGHNGVDDDGNDNGDND